MRVEGVEGPAPERPAPRLPLQSLEVYEEHGGHTLRRHVLIQPGDVLRRIVNDGIAADGRFLDKDTAQLCLETAVSRRAGQIRSWLRGNDRGAPFVFDEDMGRVIGNELTWSDIARGNVTPHPVTAVRVVLRRYPALPGGFTVITEFPTRARRRTS